jgi:heat shock protein HslJ
MRSSIFLATLIAACSSVAALAHEQHLEGSEWGIVGDEGAGARFVSFAGSDRMFGFAGCNRISGTYTQHDAHLEITAIAMTKKACAPEIMAKEQAFIDMLSKVRGVRVEHTLLLFLDEAGSDVKALTRRNAETSIQDDQSE